MASVRDVKFQSSSDWFLFHLSHLEDFQFSTLETLWPQCEKCRAVYESLVYTSTEGEFGLMTKEILENLAKVGTYTVCTFGYGTSVAQSLEQAPFTSES